MRRRSLLFLLQMSMILDLIAVLVYTTCHGICNQLQNLCNPSLEWLHHTFVQIHSMYSSVTHLTTHMVRAPKLCHIQCEPKYANSMQTNASNGNICESPWTHLYFQPKIKLTHSFCYTNYGNFITIKDIIRYADLILFSTLIVCFIYSVWVLWAGQSLCHAIYGWITKKFCQMTDIVAICIQWRWNVSTIGLVGWDNWPFEWILSCQMKMHFFSSTIVLLCSLRFLQRIRFITITFASESFVMHGLCSINCYHFIWWLDMVRVNMCTKVKIRKMITVLDKWIKKNETKTNQTNDHTGIHFQLIIISNLHMYVIVSKIKRKNRFYCGKTMIESK